MVNSWFESVAVAQQRAKQRLPKSVYGALIAGTERGSSMNDNLAAFDELGVRPITAGQSPIREMATEVMGQPMSMPVMISPTGVQAVHPDGEVAVARAARGTRRRHGPQLVREQAARRRDRRESADVLPDLLGG